LLPNISLNIISSQITAEEVAGVREPAMVEEMPVIVAPMVGVAQTTVRRTGVPRVAAAVAASESACKRISKFFSHDCAEKNTIRASWV
jgi:hypothetical protein